MANFLKLLIIKNDLAGIDYVEPYAGGASVALSLLYEEYVDSIHINDYNVGVYAFWILATRDPDYLCSRIRDVPLDVDEWRRQREVYRDLSADRRDVGFATFYLNRTNRSGIVSGGVIGGLDQTGPWKIDARFDREGLCNRVQKIARFGSRINVTNMDALGLLRTHKRTALRKLLYLDPPYYVKGSRLYDNFYAHVDHAGVRDCVVNMPGPWVVSYDCAPQIIELYMECNMLTYKLGYSASAATTGAEAMFFSEDLTIPEVSSPAGIRTRAVIKAKQRVMERTLDLGPSRFSS